MKLAQRVQLVRADRVAQQRERLPDLAFRRYVANMWTEREGFWLPEGAGQRCIGEPKFTPGEDLFLGVDVGGQRGTSAVAWLNERLHVGVEIYRATTGGSTASTRSGSWPPATACARSTSIRGGSARAPTC